MSRMTDHKWRQFRLEDRERLLDSAPKKHWLTVEESVVHQAIANLSHAPGAIEPYEHVNGHSLALNEKPLNQTQVKNLTAIVEGDMRSLQDAVVADIERRVRHRLEQVEQEFGAVEGWESWRSRYTDLVDQFNNQLQALGQEVEKAGFTTSMSPVSVAYDRQFYQGSFWKRTGADAARGRILSASDSMKRAVGVIIGREQRKVNRQILMQSLPGAPGPLEIIRDIPTAEEMLEMIRVELAEKDPDLVTELLD